MREFADAWWTIFLDESTDEPPDLTPEMIIDLRMWEKLGLKSVDESRLLRMRHLIRLVCAMLDGAEKIGTVDWPTGVPWNCFMGVLKFEESDQDEDTTTDSNEMFFSGVLLA